MGSNFSLKNCIPSFWDFFFCVFLIQVRIFKPGNVIGTLKRSLKEYVQASVGISNKGKLWVPKFLYCFSKGIVEDSLLPEWISQFLSPEQATVVRDCSSNPKRRFLSARNFNIRSFDSRFRYLFLLEDRTLPKKQDDWFYTERLPMILFEEIGSTCQMKQVSAFFFHSFLYWIEDLSKEHKGSLNRKGSHLIRSLSQLQLIMNVLWLFQTYLLIWIMNSKEMIGWSYLYGNKLCKYILAWNLDGRVGPERSY